MKENCNLQIQRANIENALIKNILPPSSPLICSNQTIRVEKFFLNGNFINFTPNDDDLRNDSIENFPLITIFSTDWKSFMQIFSIRTELKLDYGNQVHLTKPREEIYAMTLKRSLKVLSLCFYVFSICYAFSMSR